MDFGEVLFVISDNTASCLLASLPASPSSACEACCSPALPPESPTNDARLSPDPTTTHTEADYYYCYSFPPWWRTQAWYIPPTRTTASTRNGNVNDHITTATTSTPNPPCPPSFHTPPRPSLRLKRTRTQPPSSPGRSPRQETSHT